MVFPENEELQSKKLYEVTLKPGEAWNKADKRNLLEYLRSPKMKSSLINSLLIRQLEPNKKVDVEFEEVIDNDALQKRVDKFKLNIQSQEEHLKLLVIRSNTTVEQFLIAGLDSKKQFNCILIEDSNSELFITLKESITDNLIIFKKKLEGTKRYFLELIYEYLLYNKKHIDSSKLVEDYLVGISDDLIKYTPAVNKESDKEKKDDQKKAVEARSRAIKRLHVFVYDDLKHGIIEMAAKSKGSEWSEVMKGLVFYWLYSENNLNTQRFTVKRKFNFNFNDVDDYINLFWVGQFGTRKDILDAYDPIKAKAKAITETEITPNSILIFVNARLGSWCTEGREPCVLDVESAIDVKAQQTIIQDFQKKFETKKGECAVLITHLNADKLIIAGYSDMGQFRVGMIDESPGKSQLLKELLLELDKKPLNKSKIVDKIIPKIDRTRWGSGPVQRHWKSKYSIKNEEEIPDVESNDFQDTERPAHYKLENLKGNDLALKNGSNTTSSEGLKPLVAKFKQLSLVLTPQQREVFLYRHIYDFDPAKIARILHIPMGQVSVVLHAAYPRYRIGLVLYNWYGGLKPHIISKKLHKYSAKDVTEEEFREYISEILYDPKYKKARKKYCKGEILAAWNKGLQPDKIYEQLNNDLAKDMNPEAFRKYISEVLYDPKHEKDRKKFNLNKNDGER